ncbi:MAG: chemotaxis protein CheW, partial [Bacteroidetes bacterium RIFOXYC12_FULL_35_7]
NSYLSFKLGEEIFAANVSKVLNILEMTKITKVPKAPEYMKGVINLRGTVLPVVDTRVKFSMSATEFTTNTCILVLDIDIESDSLHVGALVDAVQEVLEIEPHQILPPPNIGNKFRSEFINGMYKLNEEQFIMLLDMDKVFSVDDLLEIREIAPDVYAENA